MRPADPACAQQVSWPRNVLTATLAFAEAEWNMMFHASDEPSGLSGPRIVFVIRAGAASAFQAFARSSAIRYASSSLSAGFLSARGLHASCAWEASGSAAASASAQAEARNRAVPRADRSSIIHVSWSWLGRRPAPMYYAAHRRAPAFRSRLSERDPVWRNRRRCD